jgi:gamma-glutamyltranspeptidase/glutathione hydrolase
VSNTALHDEPFQSRPVVMGTHAAVSTPHHLASQTAIDVLRAGGNAVDASVAAAAVCTVVQPFSSSIGGLGWATVHDATSKVTEVLQFHGSVPARIDPDAFMPDSAGLVDWRELEGRGSALLGSLTPGLVPGWAELLSKKGTWSLSQVLAPAIELAREGFPVSGLLHQITDANQARLQRWAKSSELFLPGGRPLLAGQRLVQADLARTLERIARNGADEMVSGATAASMIRFYQDHGGAMTLDDLAADRPRWYEPLTSRYRSFTVRAAPGPLGDLSFVAGLNILDTFPPFAGPHDPGYVHASVESAKLVSGERARYLGADADAATLGRLLSAEHIGDLAGRIGPVASVGYGVGRGPEDTITLAVVDGMGNAVHLMQTVGNFFGTGAIAGDTGFFANSSMYFVYVDGSGANRIIPGGKVEQNPCVAMLFDPDGELRLIVGSPGGKTRVETVRQMVVNVVDFGMNLQQAVDNPRFLCSADGITIDFEERYGQVDPALRAELERRGHRLRLAPETFGTGQAVAIDRLQASRLGAADWRQEAVALAY